GSIELFDFAFRIILDYDFQWFQHSQHPRRSRIKIVANKELQLRHVDGAVRLRHANTGTESTNTLGSVAAPPHSGNGRQSRIIPSAYMFPFDKLKKPPLTHHGVIQVQSREFVLTRTTRKFRVVKQIVDHPIVEFAIIFKL